MGGGGVVVVVLVVVVPTPIGLTSVDKTCFTCRCTLLRLTRFYVGGVSNFSCEAVECDGNVR